MLLKIIQNKILLYVMLAALAAITTMLFISNNKNKGLVATYKKSLIEADYLRKSGTGSYRKLVNDTKTQSELNSELKALNNELYKELKALKAKVVSTTDVAIKPKDINTKQNVNVDTNTGVIDFVDYYPNKVEPFITYTGKINKDSINSSWKFDTIGLMLVAYEKIKGIYEVDLKGPEWIQVTDLQINSLPPETMKADNLDFVLGTGVMTRTNIFDPTYSGSIGFRKRRTIVLFNANTQKQIGIGAYRLF